MFYTYLTYLKRYLIVSDNLQLCLKSLCLEVVPDIDVTVESKEEKISSIAPLLSLEKSFDKNHLEILGNKEQSTSGVMFPIPAEMTGSVLERNYVLISKTGGDICVKELMVEPKIAFHFPKQLM